MIEKKSFKKTFGVALESFGYRRGSQTWHKSGVDVISAIDLQKSNFSELYFVTVGFSLTALSGADLLPTNHSHISFRAERLLPEFTDEICDLFRLDFQKLDTDEHVSALRQFVQNHLAPSCLSLLSLDALRERYASGGFRNAGVHIDAQPILRNSSQLQSKVSES